MTVYVIIADSEVDQIIEGKAHCARELRDLRAMGCTVKAKAFDDWSEAQAWADAYEG